MRNTGPWLVVVALLLGCGPGPRVAPQPRYGGLYPERRIDTYRADIQRFTLANGLAVVLLPDHRTNLVSIDLRLAVGAAEDPPGKTGLAHLVEHLSYELRAVPESPGLGSRLASFSLGHNAYTTFDETHYSVIGLYQDLETLLSLEAERLEPGCERIPADVFEREKQVVLREIDQRDSPASRLDQAVRTAFYPADHPYHRSVGGTDVARLTAGDVCRFMTDHYAPGRAVLVIGGRFEADDLSARLQRRFGRLTRVAAARAPLPALPAGGPPAAIDADVEEGGAIVLFPAPTTGSTAAVHFTVALRMLLMRLWSVRDEHGFVTSIDFGRLGGDRAGVAYVALSVRRMEDAQRAVDLLFAQQARLLDADAGRVLRLATSTMELELLGAMSEFMGRGIRAADYMLYGGDPTLTGRDLGMVERMTVRDLDATALGRDRARVLVVRPRRGGKATARRALPEAPAALDVITTRAAVDPGEADRPLALPVQPVPVDVRELKLPNGLRVLLAPRRDGHMVDARLIFPVGTEADPVGRRGLAELSAHLLEHDFEGRYRMFDHRRVSWALGLGTDLDKEVDRRTTRFRARGLALYADWHVWRLHWLLEDGVYEASMLEELRAKARRARRAADRAGSVLDAELGGGADLLEATSRVTLADLQGFRAAGYRADGATLVVVGKFDPVAMESLIRNLWGTWPGGRTPGPRSGGGPAGGAATGPRYLHAIDDERVQPTIALAFRGEPGHGHVAVQMLLRGILEERVEAIRERLGASYGLQVTTQGGSLVIRGEVGPERAGDALRLLIHDLAALRGGPRPEEFIRARRKMLGIVLAEAADVDSTADRLELVAGRRLPLDYVVRLARALATATPAQVAAVAGQQLAEERMLLLVTGRAEVIDRTLRTAGITGSRRVD